MTLRLALPQGVPMASYCFSLSLDGAELPVRSQDLDTGAEALAYGREMLLQAARKGGAALAYCVVYASEGTDTEPLGSWDYDRATPEPVWSPNEE